MILALLGTLACLSGAAIETALSGGYNLCQFFNLRWGKNLPPKSAPASLRLTAGVPAQLSRIIPILELNHIYHGDALRELVESRLIDWIQNSPSTSTWAIAKSS